MNDLTQILDKVQKPGRYIGEETNSVRKSSSKDKTSIVLAYPDVYEVGMSYLGLYILYHLLNEHDDIICERVFMPWDDMQKELSSSGRKLFSLESKTDMNKFDIVGFSLPYELTYTNVLSMLYLGGITLLSKDRREEETLVIAGGTCAYNPEPMSAFIDAFIIGDGEESLPGFIEEYKRIKTKGANRRSLLKGLAKLPGVYVPSLYEPKYSNGKFLRLKPVEKDVPPVVEKSSLSSLENAYYPVKQMVPLVKVIHDRMAVEIARGCPNRCRFCQAGIINRPVRLRTVNRIRDICRQTYRQTGYERVALLSLSSVNHPDLTELVKALVEDFRDEGVGISIPSLRVDEAFYGIPEMISAIRKTGLTFAPEVASDSLRKSLGKDIDIQVLYKSAQCAFSHGWRNLKLYFMVGFPGEPQDEADRIIKVAYELSRLKKTVTGGAAEIRVSVNPFVPKAHSPFQWIGMRPKDELARKKKGFASSPSKKVRVEFSNLEQSLLEATLARGDRALTRVIFTAWKKGAKMDSWMDFFDSEIWKRSFEENGLDIQDCACKNYALSDALPWAHIKTGVSEEYLKREFEQSGFLTFING